ncbi:hypothetical protein [Hymenobacter pini]|uniref:hypothetical protein n=1 Tax=Hymenobacter pini TaxID=2880879 RepID=UPI001CF3B90B|nr:hypothetical protein [Hymenobacter pini]MCA8833041.1 hypothetical protein [Hymenobacter pini]
MLRIALPLSLLALLATTAQAQVVTDPARATAALDSLLQSATAVRQQLHMQTHHFETKSPWSGRRRQRVRGFAPGASARYIWE